MHWAVFRRGEVKRREDEVREEVARRDWSRHERARVRHADKMNGIVEVARGSMNKHLCRSADSYRAKPMRCAIKDQSRWELIKSTKEQQTQIRNQLKQDLQADMEKVELGLLSPEYVNLKFNALCSVYSPVPQPKHHPLDKTESKGSRILLQSRPQQLQAMRQQIEDRHLTALKSYLDAEDVKETLRQSHFINSKGKLRSSLQSKYAKERQEMAKGITTMVNRYREELRGIIID